MYAQLSRPIEALALRIEQQLLPVVQDARMNEALQHLLHATVQRSVQELERVKQDARVRLSYDQQDVNIELHLTQRYALRLVDIAQNLIYQQGDLHPEFLTYLDHASYTPDLASTFLQLSPAWSQVVTRSCEHLSELVQLHLPENAPVQTITLKLHHPVNVRD